MSYQQDCFLDYVESNGENVCNECGNTQSEGEELTKGFCADCYEFYSNDLENSTETLTPESEFMDAEEYRAIHPQGITGEYEEEE